MSTPDEPLSTAEATALDAALREQRPEPNCDAARSHRRCKPTPHTGDIMTVTTHQPQEDILDFHRAIHIPESTGPAIRRPELRAELIREEAQETVNAILARDLVGAIDGLCDMLAVTYGAAAEFGVDLAPFWAEVHRTNMAKASGPIREDGKRLKPPGWQPPRIAEMLDALAESYCAPGTVSP